MASASLRPILEPSPPATETESPPENQKPPCESCRNCGTTLLGPWCHQCGQEAHDPLGRFGSALHTLLDDSFHFDNRVWRTLVPLFLRPGYLTAEYFRGHRVRYVAPFKLMFFLAVAAFFVIHLTLTVVKSPARVTLSDLTRLELARTPQAVRLVRTQEIDTVTHRLDQADLAAGLRKKDLKVAQTTIDQVARERLAQLARGTPKDSILQLPARLQAGLEHPREWLDATFRLLPVAMLVLLPFFALLLKLLIRRRSYIEHLIVALHSHAFVFLDLIVLVSLSALASWTAGIPFLPGLFSSLGTLTGLWLFVYPGLMQKRVYGQSAIGAVGAYALIGLLYSFLLLVFVVGVLALSLWHGF
jgi:hypothetical protein